MSLLELKNIGKIYSSKSGLSVGIRGVNLSFELGEFVAVTGKSGSGKSTLLNVISGIDTYEEGEMLIEGKKTSHFSQEEYEEYREKYISFIFQDYNIIDSFTVLENIELSLMNVIEDKKLRKQKALELIHKVGLDSHKNSKGSKLSGGQKQRTVIARALAKDAPIILADEPTGNLDSKAGKEIINLLKEVSKDKLVIIVTHNFEEVQEVATREIRVFDNKIEYDNKLKQIDILETKIKTNTQSTKTLKKSMYLGLARFKAKPKYTLFITFLMIICATFLTFIFSISIPNYSIKHDELFNEIDGRLIITKKETNSITKEDLEKLKQDYNILPYDFLLDKKVYIEKPFKFSEFDIELLDENIKLEQGNFPTKTNEVILKVPIYFKTYELNLPFEIELFDFNYVVTGLDFYYDNTKPFKLLISKENFELLTLQYFLVDSKISVKDGEANIKNINILIDNRLDDNSYYTYNFDNKIDELTIQTDILNQFNINTYVNRTLDVSKMNKQIIDIEMNTNHKYLILSQNKVQDLLYESFLKNYYTQCSILFESNREAKSNIEHLNELGYNAYLSNITRNKEIYDTLLLIVHYMYIIMLGLAYVLFISSLLYLCTNKVMLSTKKDIAIMRSMGIGSKVIKNSITFQMIYVLLVALIFDACLFATLYLVPETNELFNYLHFKDYLIIIIILILVVRRLCKSYIKQMFNMSVKTTLTKGITE